MRKFLLLALALSTVACGGSRRKTTISHDPLRDGSSLEPVAAKYNDLRPGISDDGTKLVFVSGRDSTDALSTLKAYKADWPAGAAPGELKRVTATDLGVEKDAVLSGDGAWIVLVVATPEGQTDLYLQDFAGAKAAVRVTSDAASETDVTFSPDSKLLVWIARAADGKSSVQLVTLGDGSDAAVATKVAVTKAEELPAQLFWIPTGDASYKLAIGAPATAGKALLDYKLRAFTAAADAATVTPTDLKKDYRPVPSVAPAAGPQTVVFPRKALPSEAIGVQRTGDYAQPPETILDTAILVSEPILMSLADSTEKKIDPAPGYEVLSATVDATGTVGFLGERHIYRCANADAASYGSSVLVQPLDGSAGVRFIPRVTKVENGVPSYDVIATYCETLKPDGTARVPIDDRIAAAFASRSSTATKYRLVYVSRTSGHFDDACHLKLGDPEIMLGDADGDTKTVYPLSSNRAPQKDAEVSTPCAI